MTAEWQGDLAQARWRYEEALALLRCLGETYWVALLLTNLADLALAENDVARASMLVEEGLAGWRQEGDHWGLALGLGTAAAVAAKRGDRAEAAAGYKETLALFTNLGDDRGIASGLVGVADLAYTAGRRVRAARLLGAARALGEARGIGHLAHHTHYTQVLAVTRASLNPPAFRAAQAAGRALSLGQALAEAATELMIELDGPVPLPAASDRPRLTRRELEVMRLLIQRSTDREIAAILSISPRTVSDHVASVCAKLGVRSRRHVAAAAARFRLH